MLNPDGLTVKFSTVTSCVQVIRCADFYSGCGGLSFMDAQTDKAHITTAWAVDYCQNMALSFRANYPETEVGSVFWCCSVDPFQASSHPSSKDLLLSCVS